MNTQKLFVLYSKSFDSQKFVEVCDDLFLDKLLFKVTKA